MNNNNNNDDDDHNDNDDNDNFNNNDNFNQNLYLHWKINQSYNIPGIIGGLTTSLMVRAYGQLAAEKNISEQTSVASGVRLEGNNVFHLPASLLIRKTRKESFYYGRMSVPIYKTVTDMLKNDADLGKVKVITNLDEKNIEDTKNQRNDGAGT
ncbi:hypothetical protein PIROE2DRAFT_11437 [Piromyces sp. E2]|nr:hypothetical protein PIROE2DRAFT_11437 [Piromyces sp. E2]|eukprot:OUM62330.1 hypothetical protein PIROE2DRAFT_11437 [Piromyces sp. E2]